MLQGYSVVGDNTQLSKPLTPSFVMESVTICHLETFRGGNLALRTFVALFLTIYMLKSLFCENILVEYEFKSEKFKRGIDGLKIKLIYT